MPVQKLLMPIIAAMVIPGIAVAQKTSDDQAVSGTKTLIVAPNGPKLEKASYLGVATTRASAALREQLKLKAGIGLSVEHVDQASPAEQAGLKQYDIIEKFNDQWLVSPEQLAVLIRMAEPNSEIKLTIIRQAQPQTLVAKLTEKEMPAFSVFNGIDDSSMGLSVVSRGSGTMEIGDPKNPGAGGIFISPGQAQVIKSISGNYILTFSRENGKTHLNALNRADNSQLFNGNLDSEQDLNDLPPELAQRVRQLLSTMKISLPTTQPAAR